MKSLQALLDDEGNISVGRLSPFDCVAAAAQRNSLAMLMRRDGETLTTLGVQMPPYM